MNEAWRDELASSTNKAKSNQMNFTIDSFDWFAWFGWNGIVFFFCFGWVGQASQLFQPAGRDGLWALARHPNKQSKRKKTMEWKQEKKVAQVGWGKNGMKLMKLIEMEFFRSPTNQAAHQAAPLRGKPRQNQSFLSATSEEKLIIAAEPTASSSLLLPLINSTLSLFQSKELIEWKRESWLIDFSSFYCGL